MILFSKWMQVPISTRHKIAEVFGFKKVRSTHVSNDIVIDDGFNIKDIEEALTVEKMQAYTGSTETNMNTLFGLTVDKAEGKIPTIIASSVTTTAPVVIENITSIYKPPKRNAKTKTRKQK